MSPDLTNLTDSLQAAGIQDGEHLIAVAQQGQVSTTKKAFAAWCYGGNCVVAWGPPESGGDSSGIRDQLRNVQQIQATTGGAFSAILADGSVVSWASHTMVVTAQQFKLSSEMCSKFRRLMLVHLLQSWLMDRS